MSLRALRGEKSEKLMPRMQNKNVSSKLQAYRETNRIGQTNFQSQSILTDVRRLKSGFEIKIVEETECVPAISGNKFLLGAVF